MVVHSIKRQFVLTHRYSLLLGPFTLLISPSSHNHL
jgi:hypothetical protein